MKRKLLTDCDTFQVIAIMRPPHGKAFHVNTKYASKLTAINAWRYFKHSADCKAVRLYFGDQDEAARLRVQLRKTDGLPSEENLLWMATVGKRMGLC